MIMDVGRPKANSHLKATALCVHESRITLSVHELVDVLAPFVKRSYEEANTLRLDTTLRHASHHVNFRGRCPMHSCPKYTNYWCKVCGIALHFGRCFELYHGVEDILGIDVL